MMVISTPTEFSTNYKLYFGQSERTNISFPFPIFTVVLFHFYLKTFQGQLFQTALQVLSNPLTGEPRQQRSHGQNLQWQITLDLSQT